jgi:hypothetical protein
MAVIWHDWELPFPWKHSHLGQINVSL